MHSATVSNRLFLGIVAFSVSFGLSLVPNWDYTKAFVTGIITLFATYAAAFCVDKRRKNHEMLVLNSLRKRIKELEELKSRIVREINQIEEHRSSLYAESKQLQNKVAECRNQRDSLHRELSTFASQKKQLETEISVLKVEVHSLDKNKTELNTSFSVLTSEKRRLELNCNVSRSEINQLQNQICELQQEKQELESNLTLLGRLKPQVEEKLYELRIQLQDLEVEVNQKNQLLINTTSNRENIESSLNYLQTKTVEQQAELQHLQEQVSLLQEERDLLQSQVRDLLQQIETINPEILSEKSEEDIQEIFPFEELIQPIEIIDIEPDTSDILPEEWNIFLQQLPDYEIQVLKAILEQENSRDTIKQIAEANITMPNLLIDSINDKADDTLGELIIDPRVENPEIYHEHITNVKKIIAIYQHSS
ncbi:MAG: tellurite resistance TerB C-terminal domain-containing protein [Aulosira sp. ZfuVER01]|nr:tellurite resistance TerB C-terminal domain-containing protein [Aulosira sp. ZfuVER01]MDZ8002738.1 tellurite resistance TerB C-terminal domain-containing protein [Aulosira sp. DedVER01a]MDZ8054443.1 tellurite resistance TerB C-terminal domain-containing protein [Aulosira sp. ZfuCHP01]